MAMEQILYFELSWAILSTIGIANLLYGLTIIAITRVTPVSLVPIVVSAAGAIANGLCYYAFYADYPRLNTAAASSVADVMWLVRYSNLCLRHTTSLTPELDPRGRDHLLQLHDPYPPTTTTRTHLAEEHLLESDDVRCSRPNDHPGSPRPRDPRPQPRPEEPHQRHAHRLLCRTGPHRVYISNFPHPHLYFRKEDLGTCFTPGSVIPTLDEEYGDSSSRPGLVGDYESGHIFLPADFTGIDKFGESDRSLHLYSGVSVPGHAIVRFF